MRDSITIRPTPELIAEAEQVADEMGLDVETIALSAFEGYMDGVRAARLADADER